MLYICTCSSTTLKITFRINYWQKKKSNLHVFVFFSLNSGMVVGQMITFKAEYIQTRSSQSHRITSVISASWRAYL